MILSFRFVYRILCDCPGIVKSFNRLNKFHCFNAFLSQSPSLLKGLRSMPPKRKLKKNEKETEVTAPEVEEPPKKKGRKATKAADKEDDGKKAEKKEKLKKQESEDGEKPAMKKKSSREKIPDLSLQSFNSEAKTEDGKKWNIKISSWNINGIRAWLEKDGISYLSHEKPDILCVQEIKCAEDKIPDECEVDGYHCYWSAANEEGYAGTGLYTKTKPINVTYGLGIAQHDKEGRLITAEYEKFYLVTSYVPNSGRGLPRLPYRTKKWDVDLRDYLKKLDKKKPVVFCGDLNVAHEEIDLKNPKTNKKTAGFTKEERAEFTKLLDEGFIDSFRKLYPEQEEAFTFWTYMMNARAKNNGWRLDYFVLSERLEKNLCDNIIRKDVFGSDHCPIVLLLAL